MDPDAPMIFHILFYSCVFAAKFFSLVPQRRSKETGARKRICDTGSESVEVDKSVFTYLFTISCLSCMPVRLLSLYDTLVDYQNVSEPFPYVLKLQRSHRCRSLLRSIVSA